jgi:ABC-2 type transport system ATP-binding protein
LREGRVLARGTPDELREQTRSRDLADAFLRLIEEQETVAPREAGV